MSGNGVVYDGSDNLIMRFEYADARMQVSMVKDGTRYYLGYDQVGTLKAVANASGNIIKQIDYDTFGFKIGDTNPLFTVPFGFAGGLHDRDTGLVRFGFRDYDPETGRWTAKDPIGSAGGDSDLYGYCLNDPVNWMDPWGLEKSLGERIGARVQWQVQAGDLQASDKPISVSGPLADAGAMLADESAQVAAENLAEKHIGLVAGVSLRILNALLGILDPLPPPAGGPLDYREYITPFGPPPDLPWENDTPCK